MEEAQTLELVGNQQLVIETTPAGNLLNVVGSDGRIKLSVHITAAGPILHFEGAGLMLHSSGPLAIDAQSVVIQGREGIALLSGGDAEIRVTGDLTTEARIQNVTATLGNVNVKANDDVKLNGERIKMNC